MLQKKKSPFKQFVESQLTFRKVLFQFLFNGFHIGIFILGWWKQVTDERLAGLNTLQYSVWISRGAGLVLSVDTTLILLPMCRTLLRIVRPKIKILPLDESNWFHRQVAYQMLFYVICHVSAHYVNFFNVEKSQIRPNRAVDIHYAQAGGITGHVMLLCMLLMYTTAHARIRKQSFEAFWYTHHLFIPFLLGMYTHATGCFVRDTALPFSPFDHKNYWTHCIGYNGWRWELIAGGIYLIERVYREVRSRRETKITKVLRHTYKVVEIQFVKPSMKYRPGQWLSINCPEVSKYQWHPFTITSCPFDDYISIHMRQVGDFTTAFANALGAGPAQAAEFEGLDPLGMYEIAIQQGSRIPQIRIDGPYGAPAEDVLDNEIAVMIGTGIGVTPWASVLKNIWHLRHREKEDPSLKKMKLKKLEFIWVCADRTSFQWFQTLLATLENQTMLPDGRDDGFLRIHTYLTEKMNQDDVENINLNSIGMEYDPLTHLRSWTSFGRPQFPEIFRQLAMAISTGEYLPNSSAKLSTTVGVYFCGPSLAARTINQACRAATTKDVKFKFKKEHF